MFGRLKVILLGLVFGVGGLWMFVGGVSAKYDEHKLNTLGKSATVVRIVPGTSVGNTDEVRLRDDDGTLLTRRLAVPFSVTAKLRQHEEVTIDYLPDDPSLVRWTGQKGRPLLGALMGLAVWVFGALLLGVALR